MPYLIILFIGIPMMELALLLKVHEVFHFWPTFLLVISTGIIGSFLVKWQGLSLLLKIREEMNRGNIPAPQMIDGVMILIAGAFLITPGLITDSAGFLLLIPFIREKIRFALRKKLEEKVRNGSIHINVNGPRDFQ